MTVALSQPSSHQRQYVCEVGDEIRAQVSFWEDDSRVKGFIGGVGSGKTFAGAAQILAMPPGSSGMVVAPTYPMLRDLCQTTFFDDVCPPSLIREHNKSENKTTLINGTTIIWRSAEHGWKRLRGPNLGWLWVDEAAFIGESSWKVLIGRIRRRPGKVWITSTPNGQNWLHDWWCVRDLGYTLHNAHTKDNPYNIPTYFSDLERAYEDDPEYAAQELRGAFVSLDGSKAIPAVLLEAVYEPRARLPLTYRESIVGHRGEVYTLPDSLRVYQYPQKGRSYVQGNDCAEGVGGDDSTGVMVDKDTGEAVAVLAGQHEPKEHHPAMIALLSRWYNGAPAMIERNNHGHAVIAGASRHGVVCLSGPDGRQGWPTTGPSKASAYGEAHAVLRQCKRDDIPILFDKRLKNQLASINRLTLKGPGKGKLSKVDDEAIAWVLAQQGRTASPVAQARSRKAMAKMLGRRRS